MPQASAYAPFTAALVTRLRARPVLSDVNVLDRIPVNVDDMRGETGRTEVIFVADAQGTSDDVVFCGGDLRFDETLLVTVGIEVHGDDSDDTQPAVKARASELLYEIAADVAAQQDWDFTALGLNVFDYVFFTPATVRWVPGRLQQTGVFAAACDLGIEVRSRRTFT